MATISETFMGVMAFIPDGVNQELVMMGDQPIVSWGLKVSRLQSWIATLEQMANDDPASPHRQTWEEMLATFSAATQRSADNHDKLVALSDDSPSLSAYLTAYAAAVGDNTMVQA